MRITPLDIRKQEFRRGMRGLDPDEVHAFLATVADEYEAVLNDNKALRERVLELDEKVQEYRGMEKTLRDTLLTAERVTMDSKDNARREANLIIKEAQIEAEKALRDIKNEAMKLRQQIQQLRSQRESYLAKMRVVAQSHVQFIDSAVADFKEEDAAPEVLEPEPRRPAREAAQRPRPARALFDPDAEPLRSGGATPRPQRPAAAPTERPLASPPERPVATVERPAAAPAAEAPGAKPARGRGDAQSLSDLSEILERMAEGQREILHVDHAVEDAPNDFKPLREAEAAPEKKPERDVTGEWSLEQIRRNIMASYDDETDR